MPKFSTLALQGSPATKAQPGKGTHQEDKSAWALEVALDVEVSHAIAPKANILLVTTPTAETLGVQGFPQVMNAAGFKISSLPSRGFDALSVCMSWKRRRMTARFRKS